MKVRNKLMATAAALVMMGSAAFAQETVIKSRTVTAPQHLENANMINFSAFDHNNDGILSMEEVGEKLFYIFDRDGNEVIDNIEFDRNSMMTIAPMEKETITMVDHYGDGTIEHATYSYDTFLRQSQLARFATDHNGLSPKEFIGSSFLRMDDNDDKAIVLQEWKEEYMAMVMPKSAEQERYN